MALNFPCKIYQILENESPDIVRWHSSNIAFRIIDHERFEKEIIPKYFRHNQLSSLQRQLNLYGFKCISRGDDKGAFFHPKFKRGEWEAVKKITRYINPKKGEVGSDRHGMDRLAGSSGKMVKKEKSFGDSGSESGSSVSTPSVYPAVSLPSSYMSRKVESYKPPVTLSSTYPKTVTSLPFKAPSKPLPTPASQSVPPTPATQSVSSIPSMGTAPVGVKVSTAIPATAALPSHSFSIPSHAAPEKATSASETKDVESESSPESHSHLPASSVQAHDSSSHMMYEMYDPFTGNHFFSGASDTLLDSDYNLEAEMNLLYDVTSDSSTSSSTVSSSASTSGQPYFYPQMQNQNQNGHSSQPQAAYYYHPQGPHGMVPMNHSHGDVYYPYPYLSHTQVHMPAHSVPQQAKQMCERGCNTDLTIANHDQEVIFTIKE